MHRIAKPLGLLSFMFLPACGSISGPGNSGTVSIDSATSRESWAWVYTNWQTSLTAIGANPNSFTHVSPTFYSLNYDYLSGVAFYANCPVSSGYICSANGNNSFDTMTTAQFAAQVKSLGMATIPAIYAGAANGGTDQGVQNILANTNGAGTNFISAMVTEAVNNGYDGYNLDWEMGSGVTASDANAFVSFANTFKSALAAHNMTLSVDAIASNINGSWCSGNNGYLDFAKLSNSSIDRVIVEDYTSSLGANTTQCEAVLLSAASPAQCPVNSSNTNVTAVGLFNYMCANLPANMIVIGLESYSGGTNPIAGSAIGILESYGLHKVAVWPEVETGYPFLSANRLVATQSDWYGLLSSFLSH